MIIKIQCYIPSYSCYDFIGAEFQEVFIITFNRIFIFQNLRDLIFSSKK
jgi:hypothetical protein